MPSERSDAIPTTGMGGDAAVANVWDQAVKDCVAHANAALERLNGVATYPVEIPTISAGELDAAGTKWAAEIDRQAEELIASAPTKEVLE